MGSANNLWDIIFLYLFLSYSVANMGVSFRRLPCSQESKSPASTNTFKSSRTAKSGVIIEDQGKALSLRTECVGTCGKVFQAVGVAIPPTIREL